jgi:hypothetical protein
VIFIKQLLDFVLMQVIVVTTHEGVPQEFYGAKLVGSWRYGLSFYLPLAFLFFYLFICRHFFLGTGSAAHYLF